MSEQTRAGVVGGIRHRADVRQALLKSGFSHLYPGIPTGEWHPAAVMVNLVMAGAWQPPIPGPSWTEIASSTSGTSSFAGYPPREARTTSGAPGWKIGGSGGLTRARSWEPVL